MITLKNTGITNTSKSAAILRHAQGRVDELLSDVGIESATLVATDNTKAVIEYGGKSYEFDSRWLLSQWFDQWSEQFKFFHELEGAWS